MKTKTKKKKKIKVLRDDSGVYRPKPIRWHADFELYNLKTKSRKTI